MKNRVLGFVGGMVLVLVLATAGLAQAMASRGYEDCASIACMFWKILRGG